MNAGMEISDELWKAVTGGENELIIEQSAGNIGNRFGFLVILSVVAAIAASMPQECGRQPCDWQKEQGQIKEVCPFVEPCILIGTKEQFLESFLNYFFLVI